MKHFLSFCTIVLLTVVCLPATISAKDEWLQVRSKNFNLIGNASERDIRKVATKLEQFREAFRQLFTQSNFSSAIPTNVIVFKNSSAYKPFKPVRADGKTDNFIAGYFQPGTDVNYITLSTEGEDADTYGTIFHEYVHFILDTNFGKSEVPPWYNEGLAEYYQTFAIEEDQKVKLGLPQSNHLLLLQQNKLIPLETLFKISNYALHQNGNHSRSIFYAESWALIHYLIQSGKTDGLGKFLTLIVKDVPPEKAFQEAFQINYAQMEKDLRKYVAQNSYRYTLATFKNKLSFDTDMQVTPISEAEMNAYLGDLLSHINRPGDAENYLQKAIQQQPHLSMANTSLGTIKLRQRKYDEAKTYLEKAISEDQKNHLPFYNYAYLLSREDRDEFGYVKSFPNDKSAKMRELLKKAIQLNPSFTESYELLAFVNLVNNEQLDEAVSLLQKALKYQPGNQRYALRIAEIYSRQNKFAEAQKIAEKISQAADEPEIKSQAENLRQRLRQMQEINAQNEAARSDYEKRVLEINKNVDQPVLMKRNTNEKTHTPAELAKAQAEAEIQSINQAIHRAESGKKQVVGSIQKIDCKGKTITFTVKTGSETFLLSSPDFENLVLTSFVPEMTDAQVGCQANLALVSAVLTYQPQTNGQNNLRGNLVAIDFVPNNFRLMTAAELEESASSNDSRIIVQSSENEQLSSSSAPTKDQNFEGQRRDAVLQAIKNAMRKPLAGEKRELGLLEKIECNNKGTFFYLKTATQPFKLVADSPQSLKLRSFTPEVEQVQFGCGLKQLDVPVVFTYEANPNSKNKTEGNLISLEFVPKSFVLEP